MIWSVPKRWVGETAFVIAGGPSVDFEDVTKLRGRRVIVVNSSYEIAPDFAAYCFFGDLRWWELHSERPAFKAFKGRFVSCSRSAHGEGLLKLNRIAPNRRTTNAQKKLYGCLIKRLLVHHLPLKIRM